MTELENKLREAFRARASQITTPAPPLELPELRRPDPVIRGGGDRVGINTWRRWLIPAGAVIAVLAVVAGVLAARDDLTGSAKRAAVPIQTSVPPYYVALVNNGLPSPQALPTAVATVRATATGAVIARIVPPRPYVSFDAVSGAADDRTFVLWARGNPDQQTGTLPERFYLLHINPSATSVAGRVHLTALPARDISGGNQVLTMALSPDGTSLAAILDQASLTGPPPRLYVFNLATGTTKIWIRTLCGACGQTIINGSFGAYPPVAVFLSWAANGKSLAFIPNVASPQLRLLDVGAPGNNVQTASKPFAIHGVPVEEWQDAYMTADAKTVFITYQQSKGQMNWSGLLRFSASTGKLTAINKITQTTAAGRPTGGGSDLVLWSNYDGSQLIVTGARKGPVFTSKQFSFFVGPDLTAGIYRGDRYTPIPWPADVIDAAW